MAASSSLEASSTALDLGQVAETDPGSLRDLAKGLGLRHPLLTQGLADELSDEHLLQRRRKTHVETVPSHTDTASADRALSIRVGRGTVTNPPLNRAELGDTPRRAD